MPHNRGKKNQDDEGEGEKIIHSEDLVGIRNTRIPKEIKVKSEPSDSIGKNYLRSFNRRSSKIPNNVLSVLEKYGHVQNVKPDGNCGFYSVMNGLSHIGIDHEEDINLHRKNIHDYIKNNKNELFWLSDMVWRNKNKNDYIQKHILDKCWSSDMNLKKDIHISIG